jgi:acetylornithine/succinyldiaminopimelate/putrescine aminotransferase
LAGFELLLDMMDRKMMDKETNLLSTINYQLSTLPPREQLFLDLLKHPGIKSLRSTGFLMAVQLQDADTCLHVCHECVKAGIVTDWFLFAPDCLRIAPPLIITEEQIRHACNIILTSLDKVLQRNQ